MAQRKARTRTSANQCIGKSCGHWNRRTQVRHRDYSPTLGRFIERDPIGFEAGDNNWYRFVVNGPTAKTDPNGLVGLEDVAELIMSAGCSQFTADWSCGICCSAAATAAHLAVGAALAAALAACETATVGLGTPACVAGVMTAYAAALVNITNATAGCFASCKPCKGQPGK